MSGERAVSQSRTRKITLIVLGLVAAGTVFLLPRFVDEPWLAGEAAELPAVPQPPPSSVAPSTAAELTRYRQDSQTVLAEIVSIRDRLLEQNVETWAGIEFGQALERIAAGDERYSYGDYAASLEQFRRAREQLAGIEADGRDKLANAKTAAGAAIESLNPAAATTAVELARAIAPQDPDVVRLATRLATLELLKQHVEAGDEALALDRFREARAEYRAAVELDPDHERAALSLALAQGEVKDSVFRGHMSSGFDALESADYDGARAAFRQARKVRPGDPAVGKALAQVDNRENASVVSREFERADALEAAEDWAAAQAIYESLLEEDPSLTEARVRLVPVKVRANLDARLGSYLADPLGLSSENAYRAAQGTLADARGITRPGPRLAGQIAELDSLLKIANSPVEVQFRSDNQTHVVLYRVADMGRFEQRSLQLRPGKYVASGTRSGYRDVRIEFTITGTNHPPPVVVRCEEPVG